MLIYKDVCTGDELLSDAFRIETEDEDFLVKCQGKLDFSKKKGAILRVGIGVTPWLSVSVTLHFFFKTIGDGTKKMGGGISANLIGGNPSQEDGGDEGVEDSDQVKSGIDIIINNNLEDRSDLFCTKKFLQSYLKKWAKNTATALQEKDKAKCDEFKKCCQSKLKSFLDKWSEDASVYTGEHFDPEEAKSSPLIGVWSEDGMGMTLYGIKLGLEEEKC